jgi:hypothetical protein
MIGSWIRLTRFGVLDPERWRKCSGSLTPMRVAAIFLVAAIFVAVFVLGADLHATASPIFIVVTL